MLKKRYTCFNCGKRFHQSTTNGLVDAREQVECPECSALVNLASVEEVGLPRRVCILIRELREATPYLVFYGMLTMAFVVAMWVCLSCQASVAFGHEWGLI